MSYVIYNNVHVCKHTDIQTHVNTHTYTHMGGTKKLQSIGSVTVSKPLTGSEEGDVKLKRQYIRKPCCITSDDMLVLALLPWRACSAAKTQALTIFASSSSCAVGGHKQGMALQTPASLNRAKAACAPSRAWAYCKRQGSSSAATRRNILPAFVSKATVSRVSVGLYVFNKVAPKLKCTRAVLICLAPFVCTWMRRHFFLPAISSSARFRIVVYISLRLSAVATSRRTFCRLKQRSVLS